MTTDQHRLTRAKTGQNNQNRTTATETEHDGQRFILKKTPKQQLKEQLSQIGRLEFTDTTQTSHVPKHKCNEFNIGIRFWKHMQMVI